MADVTHSTSEPQVWQLWIDTGGTFTDCLALKPGRILVSGVFDRAKVLSSGALRGRIVSQRTPTQLVVSENWGACDDLIAGFAFLRLDADAPPVRVLRYHADESMIELECALADDLPAGTAFEVCGNEPAPILAARIITNTPAGALLPPINMRLATTRSTNALLERRGAPTALFITDGFSDLLLIGDQQRPDLFALNIIKPQPLNEFAVQVRERIAADGSVLHSLDLNHVRTDAERLVAQGVRVAAVALMHSHVNSKHEQQVAQALRQAGFEHVSVSSELAPLIRLLPRAQTAVVDAYLSPVIEDYLGEVQRHLHNSRLHVMTSAGGLVNAPAYRARDSLLSGPAGGVAGAAAAGRQSGFTKIIGFDMGGTSTDVARYDNDFEYRFEQVIAGTRLMSPALAIETVAAGGGSICDCVDDRLIVGPQSAGAQPGPACYSAAGNDGPLTLTDVNLLLGRLDERQFEIPINREPAHAAARRVHDRVNQSVAKPPAAVEEMLQGFLDIANERMAAAIEQVSLRRGYDPREYAMVAFGGAGGQHACAVADCLGMQTVVMPADGSLLSALGLGHAVIERMAQQQVLKTLNDCAASLPEWIDRLATAAIKDVAVEGVAARDIQTRRVIISARLLGQDSSLAIDVDDDARRAASVDASRLADWLKRAFAKQYRTMYGHDAPQESGRPIEVESIRVIASSVSHSTATCAEAPPYEVRGAPVSQNVSAYFAGRWMNVSAFDREELSAGMRMVGPALVFDRRSACVIEPGWVGVMDAAGALVVRNDEEQGIVMSKKSKLAQQELFSNRFESIADEMGQVLQRTALSTNVKERLDFSCAVLNSDGELVVNAPHIPVHLGALGLCVRSVREVVAMEDGDVVVTNHPAYGGSHLPDVTVITPVFVEGGGPLIGYVANRAHHAEIGGTRPGSMPPAAKNLLEEGVIISPQHLIKRGESWFENIQRVLRDNPYSSRAIADNMADLHAAVAANHRGATALHELAQQHGAVVVAQQMAAITNRAERLTRAALSQMTQGTYEAVEALDDGSPIQVAITLQGDSAVIDFSGSAPLHPGNLNATPAIVHSAVIYVLRLLIGERLPLNEGIMRAVRVNIPCGMLNPTFNDDAAQCPAVVGGNTETSQRIVDVLLKALQLCAGSQGTMNNVLFGNNRFGYYETVCGGCGAGSGFHGADAVHSHMTNTRITDPEIIEHRYPVRVEQFAIRKGSGGAGTWHGGNGVVREITFLQPMSLSILSQHRTVLPFGLDGGEPGLPGSQRIIRSDGSVIQLNSIDACEVGPLDRLILETPGGGGFGQSASF